MELPAHAISPEQLDKFRRYVWGAAYDFMDPECQFPHMQAAGFTMPLLYPFFLEKIRNFPVHESDVYVNSFPKSGTTWMQHIVWYICTGDFDTEESIDYRFPNLEVPAPYPPRPENLDEFAQKTPPRLVKTHVPLPFAPKDLWKAKVIYCYRNMKDCCVSVFHHCRAMVPQCYSGTFEEFAKLFLEGKVQFGPWSKHVLGYYQAQQEGKPVLMVPYEDMKRDRKGVIRRVAAFIGKELSEEMIEKIYEATSFEAMKQNETGNYEWARQMGFWDSNMQPFMRKGIVGDWQNHFTPELAKAFDEKFATEFAGCDLPFSDQPLL